MVVRRCAQTMAEGRPCGAAPQLDRPFCFLHDPERAADVAEARRLGGIRRKREATIAAAYDLQGLSSVDGLRRVLSIVVHDALGLDNSIAKGRLLIAGVLAGAKLLEVGELESRLAALEAAHESPRADEVDAFPSET